MATLTQPKSTETKHALSDPMCNFFFQPLAIVIWQFPGHVGAQEAIPGHEVRFGRVGLGF